MNEQQFDVLNQEYQNNPYAFTPDQVNELQATASSFGNVLQRDQNADEFSLLRTIGQIGTGYISGLTTIHVGSDPRNTAEGIANSVGNLLGFVGFVPGAGTIAQFGVRTAVRAFGGSAAKAAFVATRVARGAAALKGTSVPLLAAEKIVGTAKVTRRIQKTFGAGTLADIVQGGLHLGTASAVSSWQFGVDQMIQSFGHGFIAGGAFRSIGTAISASKFPNANETVLKTARGVAGALFTGLPTTLEDAPAPLQVYEYLLGAYFGVNELPRSTREAKKFLGENIKSTTTHDRIFNIAEAPGFKDLSTDAQEEVIQSASEIWGARLNKKGEAEATDATALLSRAVIDSSPEFSLEDLSDISRWTAIYDQQIKEHDDPHDAFKATGKILSDLKSTEARVVTPVETSPVPPTSEDIVTQSIGNFTEASESVLDHDIPTSVQSPLVSFVESVMGGGPTDMVSGGRFTAESVTGLIADEFSAAKQEGTGFFGVIDNLNTLFAGVTVNEGEPIIPAESSREFRFLRQAWKRYQSRDYKIPNHYYDTNTNTLVRSGKVDQNNNNIEEFASRSHLETLLSDSGINTIQSSEVRIGSDSEKIHLGGDDGKSSIDPIVYLVNTAVSDKPLFAGIKDKAKLIHTDGWVFQKSGVRLLRDDGKHYTTLVDPSDRNQVDLVYKAKVAAIEDVLGDNLTFGAAESNLNGFVDSALSAGAKADKPFLSDVYKKLWLNNVATLEKLQGLSFEEMVKANNTVNEKGVPEGDFLLRVQDLNKRMQLVMDRSPSLDPEVMSRVKGLENGLSFVILNETRGKNGLKSTAVGLSPEIMSRLNSDGNLEKFAADHHLDGVFFVRNDVFDLMTLDAGLDANSGAIKGSVVFSGETASDGSPLGMMLGKFAVFRADEDISRSMLKSPKELHSFMFSSAAKQRGLRKAYDYGVKEDGRTDFFETGFSSPLDKGSFDTYNIPLEGFRVNSGTSEDPVKNMKDVRAVVQLLANMENRDAANAMFEQYVLPSIVGKAETNAAFRSFMGSESDVDVSSIKIDDLGLPEIVELLTQPDSPAIRNSSLYKRLIRDIFGRYSEDRFSELSDNTEDFADVEPLIREKNNTLADVIYGDLLASDSVSPFHINSDVLVGGHASDVIRSYLLKRISRPKIESSGQAILGPQDPWFQIGLAKRFGGKGFRSVSNEVLVTKDGRIQEGAFLLDSSWKNNRISWVNGKKVSLGDAFAEYVKLNTRLSDGLVPENKLRETRARASVMESLLSHDVIRVPADSPSGIRRLKLAGFTNRKGAGIHLSNFDMINLGGADLDIDKVFLFQNLDRDGDTRIGDFLRSDEVRYGLLDGNGVVRDVKSDVLDRFAVKLDEKQSHPVSALDPLLLFNTSKGAARGNALIGVSAVSGRRGHEIFTQFPGQVSRGSFKAFSRLRQGLLNMAADAGNLAGINLDIPSTALELSIALHGGRKRPKAIKNFNKVLKQLDSLAHGNVLVTTDGPSGKKDIRVRVGLYDALENLQSFSQSLQSFDLSNPWYRGLSELGRRTGPIKRPIQDSVHGSSSGASAPAQKLVRVVGMTGLDLAKQRLSVIQRKAAGGDALAKDVLFFAARKDIQFPGQGDSSSPSYVKYTEPYQVFQDVYDVASIENIYRKGLAARKAGATDDELRSVAVQVEKFKSIHSEAVRSDGKINIDSDAVEKNYQAVEAYRKDFFADRSELAKYFGAYSVGTLRPQELSRNQFVANAESAFRNNRIRQLKASGEFRTSAQLHDEFNTLIVDGKKLSPRDQAVRQWYFTNQGRFGFDPRVTSRQDRVDYLRSVNKIVDKTLTSKESSDFESFIDLTSDPNEADPLLASLVGEDAAKQPIIEANAELESFLKNLPENASFSDKLLDDQVVGPKLAKENRERVDRLTTLFRKFPNIRDHLVDAFEAITSKPSPTRFKAFGVTPEKATFVDLDLFLSFFENAVNSNGPRSALDGMYSPFIMSVMFPDYYGNQTRGVDVNLSKNRVSRPILTSKGLVNKPVRDVWSRFDKLYDVMSILGSRSTESVAAASSRLHDSLSPFRSALAEDFRELHIVAIANRQRNDHNPDGSILAIYGENFDKGQEVFKKFAGKKYRVTLPGKGTRSYTAREIVGDGEAVPGLINELYTGLNEKIANEKIVRRASDDKFVIRYKNSDTIDLPATIAKITAAVESGRDAPDISLESLDEVKRLTQLVERLEITSIYSKSVDGEVEGKPILATTLAKRYKYGSLNRSEYLFQIDYYTNLFATKDNSDSITLRDFSSYWSQNNHDNRVVKKWLKEVTKSTIGEDGMLAASRSATVIKRFIAEGIAPDGGLADHLKDSILAGENRYTPKDFAQITSKPGVLKNRSELSTVPGWDMTDGAFSHYLGTIERSRYNYVKSLIGNRLARSIDNDNVFGENSRDWARFARRYINTSIGGSQFFPKAWLSGGDLQKTPTYWTSDDAVFNVAKKADRFLTGGKWLGGVEKGTAAGRGFSRKLAHVSRLEAQYEMITLLSNTRTMFNNIVGGNLLTASSTGFKHWYNANDLSILSSINPEWKSLADVEKFVIERIGGIEAYMINEAHVPGMFRVGRGKDFYNEALAFLKKNPDAKDVDLVTIARKHEFTDAIFDGAAWFMRKSERVIRRRAAMAHYLKAREVFAANSFEFEYDHPWLLEMARAGVEATQFMYDNANRPEFSRSSLGKVLSRFQIWSWRSIDFQRRVFKEAADLKFRRGTEEFDRLKRMMIIDSFVFALAALFPMTMFESAAPAPLGFFQDFANFFFGDKKKRDDTFNGVVPYPFSPVQIALPPISRGFTSTANALVSGDYHSFTNYHIWSMLPFGLLARNVKQAGENPGKVLDIMSGIPLNRLKGTFSAKLDDTAPGNTPSSKLIPTIPDAKK